MNSTTGAGRARGRILARRRAHPPHGAFGLVPQVYPKPKTPFSRNPKRRPRRFEVPTGPGLASLDRGVMEGGHLSGMRSHCVAEAEESDGDEPPRGESAEAPEFVGVHRYANSIAIRPTRNAITATPPSVSVTSRSVWCIRCRR